MSLYVNTTPDRSAISPYVPVSALVDEAVMVTGKEKFFRVYPENLSMLDYSPGQFFMVGLPGYGEAPISISSGPNEGHIDFCIRAVGTVTNALHRVERGGRLWIRGPFGRGFDLADFKGRDIVFVAGGIGMVPMRSLVRPIISNGGFGRLTLIYGSRAPEDILYMAELEEMKNSVDVKVTIDRPAPGWEGNVGVVTTLIPGMDMDSGRTLAVIIGPPVMYKFVIMSLRAKGIKDEDMFVSLERRMKCGLGKCGHCQINNVYVCQEGPVFRVSELCCLPEAI